MLENGMGRRNFMLAAGTIAAAGCASAAAAKPEPPEFIASSDGGRFGQFRGMMPILATPVDEQRALDEASQRREIDYCIQCGAVAVGHFAFASEFQKISDTDRSRLLGIAVEQVNGRVPFFAGVTGKTVADTLRYAKEASEKGADLLMITLPYGEEMDQPKTQALFHDAAQFGKPIILQDTPATAKVFTTDFVLKLAEDTGRIQAIKAESTDFLTKTAELMKAFAGKLQVIGGAGGKHMIHLLRLGATSFMTGTEAVEIHSAVVQAYLAGDENKAAEIYFSRVLPYLMFYSGDNWLRNLKMMLHLRGIIDTPHLLQPEDDVPPAYPETEMREFLWALDQIGWRRRWPDII